MVQAVGEAEATCAALSAAGLVDSVATKDVDTLLFGAKVVMKQMKLQVGHCRVFLLSCFADSWCGCGGAS